MKGTVALLAAIVLRVGIASPIVAETTIDHAAWEAAGRHARAVRSGIAADAARCPGPAGQARRLQGTRGDALLLVDVVTDCTRELPSQGEALRAFGVPATPTVVLLGREGDLLGGAIGPRGWTEPGGRRLLEALLTSKTPG